VLCAKDRLCYDPRSILVFQIGGKGRMIRRLIVVTAIAFALTLGIGAVIKAQEEKVPDVVVLKGNPMGGVKFNHTAHVKLAEDKCETCHHPSKPEKPLQTAHQKCQGCHTKTATAPMKTNTRGAFHDALAKKGTCIDCHLKSAATSTTVPKASKCTDCHKKENGV
jgi:hypothetical protein